MPLKVPLQLRWRRGPDMPFGMGDYVKSVVVQGRVYVGGGSTGLGSDDKYGSREGQFPRWRSAVRVRSEGSALEIRSESSQ